MIQFKPDWSEVMTAKEAEAEYEGFKFNGPGFYRHNGKVMLVMPVDRPAKHFWNKSHYLDDNGNQQAFPADELFEFNCYDGHDPVDAFDLICNAPNRNRSRS